MEKSHDPYSFSSSQRQFWPKMGFPGIFKTNIGWIHLIPDIYLHRVSLLIPINFHVPSVKFGPLVAKYLAKDGICRLKTLERRKTLGHLRSINPNLIIHFAHQSQTCRLLKILKPFFSNISRKETVKSGTINLRLNWYRKSVSIIESIIYIYIYVYVEFLALHFNDLSHYKFTGWSIIELSIRRRLRTLLISWGQKTHVKHCHVDLSS